MSFRCFFFNL